MTLETYVLSRRDIMKPTDSDSNNKDADLIALLFNHVPIQK